MLHVDGCHHGQRVMQSGPIRRSLKCSHASQSLRSHEWYTWHVVETADGMGVNLVNRTCMFCGIPMRCFGNVFTSVWNYCIFLNPPPAHHEHSF